MAGSENFTIYHNPRCSKSRETLQLLRDAGHEPQIVEYLKTPPSAERMTELLGAMGKTAREAMRTKEAVYKEMGLADQSLGEDALIAQMVANPILMERPIVVSGDKARLCRPPEIVRELLD